MRKVHLVCSLLLGFCVSMFGMGCDAPAKAPATSQPKKAATPGSTTGGGTEVPAGGTKEKAKAPEAKAAPDATEPKAEEKTEPKKEETPEAKPEEKTEAKPEDK